MTRSPLQPSAGACLVAGSLVVTTALLGFHVDELRFAAAAAIALITLLAVASLWRPAQMPDLRLLKGLVGLGTLGLGITCIDGVRPAVVPAALLTVASTAAAMGVSSPSSRLRSACGVALAATTAALLSMLVARAALDTDVAVFLADGARALVHGQNPYAITFPNIYGPVGGQLAYGEGVVQDGRITYGFPYPPVVLLLGLPGLALGDPRFSGPVLLCAAVLLLLRMSRSRAESLAAALLLASPGLAIMATPGWVEPTIVALLALAVALLHRKNFAVAAAVVGLLFVSKQYFVVLVPALWLLRPYATRGRIGLLVGTAAATLLPALVWNPSAFWRSVVEWQFIQPFRPDSTSLYVAVVESFSWSASGPGSTLGLVLGLTVTSALALRLKPGPGSFAFAIAVGLTVTVLLSKQAFLNYYFLCGSALLVAGWSLAVEQRLPDTTVSSQRGTRTTTTSGAQEKRRSTVAGDSVVRTTGADASLSRRHSSNRLSLGRDGS